MAVALTNNTLVPAWQCPPARATVGMETGAAHIGPSGKRGTAGEPPPCGMFPGPCSPQHNGATQPSPHPLSMPGTTHPCKMPGPPLLRMCPEPADSKALSQRPWTPTKHNRAVQASRSRARGPQAMVKAPAPLLASPFRIMMRRPLQTVERKQSQPQQKPLATDYPEPGALG